MFKFQVDMPICFELSCTQTGTFRYTDGHECSVLQRITKKHVFLAYVRRSTLGND